MQELTTTDKEIVFQIIDWYIPENDKVQFDPDEEAREYTINIYGKTSDEISICVKVVGFKPFFYIKPPESWELLSDKEFKKKVNELQMKLSEDDYDAKFKSKITRKPIISRYYKKHLCKLEIASKKDFWGFTNNKEFRYIKIVVKSLGLFNSLKYYFQDCKDGFVMYESNIEPFLKFIHIKEIKPCGWIKINNYSLENVPDTRCDYNISADWNDIISIENSMIAPFKIASFDIECSSSHGDFPLPKKNYKKLAQDLCMISRANLDDKNLISNIIKAFDREVVLTPTYSINRLYSKTPLTMEHIRKLNEREMDIRFIMNKMKSLEIIDNGNDNGNDNDDGDDVDEVDGDEGDGDKEGSKKKSVNISVKESNEIEEALNNKLNEILPELEGDKIIQIGTTIHKYGSDEIIYKSIISLNTCDDIEGTTVISCNTERDLLLKWKNEIIKLNPDIMIGYNIWGFDMEYIWIRAIENNIEKKFARGFGRTIDREIKLIEQKLSSSALGDNTLKLFDMDGIVTIDLLKVMQREHKLDSYKLDNVASIFIGSKKDDLKPKEIFEKFKGGSDDRCIIAKYCIQDCILVNKLLHKLKIIENHSGMGNVCLVPLNYLFKRGQGIKIYSLITNECMKRGFVIPVKKYVINDIDIDGYEGAIVLEPKEGIYLDEPIVVFDYGSLYPSSMISRNLSHDTFILDNKYLDIDDPNIEIITVNYDLYEGLGDKKRKVGVKECKFAKYKDGRKGIIPDILTVLLEERKRTRSKIEYKTIIKTDGNEVIGNIYEDNEKEVIILSTDKIKYTIPKTKIKEIKDTYNKFEKDVFDALQSAYKVTANSLYGQIGAKTSPIYLKDIAACTTATGREMIMLAKEYVEKNYDADVIYGDSVMPYTPLTYKINDKVNVSTFEDITGYWIDYREFKSNETKRYYKEQYLPDNMKVWTDKGWSKVKRIIRHKTVKKIYRILTKTGLIDVTEDHSLLDNNREIIKPSKCKIGQKLLHLRPDIENYNNDLIESQIFDIEGQICLYNQKEVQEYLIILEQLGYYITIDYMNYDDDNDNNDNDDKNVIYIINYSKNYVIEDKISIIKKELLIDEYNGYVYDIETEYGVFHGGIGHLILKNTDSIFCKFPLKDEEGTLLYGKSSLPVAIKVGKSVEKNIVSIMPSPQKLNYEKCLYPFILFSKKRYVGNLYEMDINKFKQKSMGIVLKRRDNANIVKKIYGGIIDIILNKQDLDESVKFLKEELQDLVNGKTDFKDLIISKTLRSSYKDPTKIAHKVLADRIGIRDAGNKPASNDRIAYIYIKAPNAKLQGDKIETPEFIKDNELEPDYLHYITNQIMKPILQLYALCITDLNDYKESYDYWEKIDEELKLKPLYQDPIKRKRRLDNLKLLKVQEILFDEFIYKLKEPKKAREVKKKETKKKEEKEEKEKKVGGAKKKEEKEEKEEKKKEEVGEMDGEIRIINSKIKEGLCYSIKINMNKKVIYTEDNKDIIKSITKDKLLNELLIKLHKKFKSEDVNFKLNMKINYKDYVKKFNIMISKFNNYIKKAESYDPKTNDIEMVKLHKEFTMNIEILEIKDNIILIE
jgi:DNA polymerase elongation subunit (family B)